MQDTHDVQDPDLTPQERAMHVDEHTNPQGNRDTAVPVGRDPVVRNRVQAMRAAAAAMREAYDDQPMEVSQDDHPAPPSTEGADVRMDDGGDATLGPDPQGEPVAHGPGDVDVGNVDASKKGRHRYKFSRRNRQRYDEKDLSWQYIGSGTYRRVFMNAKKMVFTTKTGPAACDVMARTIRCASTGRLLDKCQVQGTPDRLRFRELPTTTDIVVELVVMQAERMYTDRGPDVCDVFSPPESLLRLACATMAT